MLTRLKQEMDERDAAFRASTKPELASFQIRDPDGWAKCVASNTDPYGFRCVQYAADWASFMERDMANGATLADCAERTSHEADHDGITGFMYGAAASILAGAWVHGEEFRRWYKRSQETQREPVTVRVELKGMHLGNWVRRLAANEEWATLTEMFPGMSLETLSRIGSVDWSLTDPEPFQIELRYEDVCF